jgi:hypothetical protein
MLHGGASRCGGVVDLGHYVVSSIRPEAIEDRTPIRKVSVDAPDRNSRLLGNLGCREIIPADRLEHDASRLLNVLDRFTGPQLPRFMSELTHDVSFMVQAIGGGFRGTASG